MIIRVIAIVLAMFSVGIAGQGMGPGPGIGHYSSGGSSSESIGNSSVGTSQATSINNTSILSMWPINGTFLNNHISVVTYTFSGRENVGLSRSVRAALYTRSAEGVYTKITGSDTGQVYYTCASNTSDVTIQSLSDVSVVAGVQYYVGWTWAGYGSFYYTPEGSTSGERMVEASLITNTLPSTATVSGTVYSGVVPGKLLLGVN